MGVHRGVGGGREKERNKIALLNSTEALRHVDEAILAVSSQVRGALVRPRGLEKSHPHCPMPEFLTLRTVSK